MDLTRRAVEFRARVSKLGPRGRGRRYPEALKREAVEYLAERRGVGRGIDTTAAELDLPSNTLRIWAATPRRATAGFVPVTIVGEGSRLVLHGPGGIRVEGLDVATLADLLRRLA